MTLDYDAMPTHRLREHHRQQLIDLMDKIYDEKLERVEKGYMKQASLDGWEKTVIRNQTIQQMDRNKFRGSELDSCTILWIFDQVMHCPELKKSPFWQEIIEPWAFYALLGQEVYDQHYPPEEEQGRESPLNDLLNRSR